MQPDVWIAETLRLPHLDRKGGPVLAWPPGDQASAAAAAAVAVAAQAGNYFHPGAHWQDFREKEEERRRDDQRRVAAYYEQQRRENEARKEAENKAWREQMLDALSALAIRSSIAGGGAGVCLCCMTACSTHFFQASRISATIRL